MAVAVVVTVVSHTGDVVALGVVVTLLDSKAVMVAVGVAVRDGDDVGVFVAGGVSIGLAVWVGAPVRVADCVRAAGWVGVGVRVPTLNAFAVAELAGMLDPRDPGAANAPSARKDRSSMTITPVVARTTANKRASGLP
jgi:hypothetical protein